jgi:hypothetical protein
VAGAAVAVRLQWQAQLLLSACTAIMCLTVLGGSIKGQEVFTQYP